MTVTEAVAKAKELFGIEPSAAYKGIETADDFVFAVQTDTTNQAAEGNWIVCADHVKEHSGALNVSTSDNTYIRSGTGTTKGATQRTLTITLKLKPDDTRQNIAVSCVAKSTLAATNPVTTSLYVADEETIVEMVPQIPGQMAMDSPDQEAPPLLKLIKTAG